MPGSPDADTDHLLSELGKLGPTWHSGGLLSQRATAAIIHHSRQPIRHSMETGCGKSTLLLSNISQDHVVFTIRDNTLEAAMASPLFKGEHVTVVEGPTQVTLPAFHFEHELDLALLDGPHGYPFPDLEYYHVYPHLAQGALLILDDIHIPTINHLFRFVSEDSMFSVVEVAGTTAILRRTSAAVFPVDHDGWWTQNYNLARFPLSGWPAWGNLRPRLRNLVPLSIRRAMRKALPKRLRQWMIS